MPSSQPLMTCSHTVQEGMHACSGSAIPALQHMGLVTRIKLPLCFPASWHAMVDQAVIGFPVPGSSFCWEVCLAHLANTDLHTAQHSREDDEHAAEVHRVAVRKGASHGEEGCRLQLGSACRVHEHQKVKSQRNAATCELHARTKGGCAPAPTACATWGCSPQTAAAGDVGSWSQTPCRPSGCPCSAPCSMVEAP